MLLRNLFIFIYLLITAILFGTFNTSIELWASFFAQAFILTGILYYHIFSEKKFSPFLSTYVVFNYLFFILAPMVQAGILYPQEVGVFDHNFPFSETLFIKTNALISLFHIIFFLFYIGIKGYISKKRIKKITYDVSYKKGLRDIFLIILISIAFLIIGFPFLRDEYILHNWTISSYSPGYQLIFKKIFFTLPLAGLVLCKYFFDTKKKYNQAWLVNLVFISIIFVLIIITKNPLIEKRNALGPVYLLIVFLFFPLLLNSNVKSCLFLFGVMVIGFPLIQIVTHIEYGALELLSNPSLITSAVDREDFNRGYMSLNYDAFCNIGIALEIVQEQGFSYGYQLLSALLFFIPRTLWATKPDSSGLLIGDYVIENHGYYFANLSNPLVSEGYMNFGILGVVIAAIALAMTCVYFLTWLNSNDYLKRAVAFYFAMHLLFLLRGDFTNGYSYFVGTFVGLYVIPKTIILLANVIFDQKIWVSKKS